MSLKRSEVVSIALSHSKVLHCWKYAEDVIRSFESGELSGKSHVRGADRVATMATDGLVGQLGMLAYHEYMQPHGIYTYTQMRWYQNMMPSTGDGGHDYPQLNVDVKASRIRDSERHLVRGYHLIVRPAERHDEWIYVRALVDFDDDWESAETGAIVHLMGWATTGMLPYKVAGDGIFKGAYVLPCSELMALMPFRWSM